MSDSDLEFAVMQELQQVKYAYGDTITNAIASVLVSRGIEPNQRQVIRVAIRVAQAMSEAMA